MPSFWFTVLLVFVLAKASQAQSQGELRLISNTDTGGLAGRVEIYISGQWGTICDDSFGQNEANVVCRQLGFSQATAYGNTLGYGFGSSTQRIWLDDVNCPSSGTNVLTDCSNNGLGVHNCGHSEDVMVRCTNEDPSLTEGNLRLAQGSVTSSTFTAGRLEIFINGQWGTICDDLFGLTEANVACEQLGYTSGASEYGNRLGFGEGTSDQPIWLDDVDCSVFDSRIIDCFHRGIGIENCGHGEDVMINCGIATTFKTITSTISIIIGCVVGGIFLIIICVVVGVIGCAFCGICAANSSSRRTATTPAPIITGYKADTATATITTTQVNASSSAFGVPAQQPPTASYASQPVQGYGNVSDPNANPQAHLYSQEAPPPYATAQQYPLTQQPYPGSQPLQESFASDKPQQPYPTQAQPPYPTNQQAGITAPYPAATDPAYPPVGYP